MHFGHIEAILISKVDADRHAAQAWFAGRGFTVTPMQAGMLISGAADLFQSVFQIDLCNATLPVRLPIPHELERDVKAIEIPKPPTYHT
jgi:hypothetical protein